VLSYDEILHKVTVYISGLMPELRPDLPGGRDPTKHKSSYNGESITFIMETMEMSTDGIAMYMLVTPINRKYPVKI
jgi:hypothetical protein